MSPELFAASLLFTTRTALVPTQGTWTDPEPRHREIQKLHEIADEIKHDLSMFILRWLQEHIAQMVAC